MARIWSFANNPGLFYLEKPGAELDYEDKVAFSAYLVLDEYQGLQEQEIISEVSDKLRRFRGRPPLEGIFFPDSDRDMFFVADKDEEDPTKEYGAIRYLDDVEAILSWLGYVW